MQRIYLFWGLIISLILNVLFLLRIYKLHRDNRELSRWYHNELMKHELANHAKH